jgi:streptomycin 3"-adenylyltransferase
MAHTALSASVEHQLQALEDLLREVLGGDLAGAYLYGSGMSGGLRPRSDVDVMALTRRHLTVDERRRLIDGVMRLSGPDAPGLPRPLELTLVVAPSRTAWRDGANFDLQYGEWLRARFAAGELDPRDDGAVEDMASLIRTVLHASRPLAGPPAADLLDPVLREDYSAGMLACIPSLLHDVDRNDVLTLARIWNTLATDEFRSKDGAADWVMPLLPEEHRPVLAYARATYLGEEDDRWDQLRADAQSCADYMAAAIHRLRDARRAYD